MTKKTFLLYILLLFTAMPVSAGKDFYEGEPVYASRWRDYRRSSYFGLRFGLNVPTVRYKGTGGEAQTNPLPRYHIGLVYGNKLGDGLPFFLESGLIYTEKGTEIEATEEVEFKKCYMRYLEIPIVLKYKLNTNADDFTVQPFFGGFMAVGVGGTTKLYDSRTKIDPFGADRYKRFDAGIRLRRLRRAHPHGQPHHDLGSGFLTPEVSSRSFRTTFPVHRGRHDASGISGTFAAWEQSLQPHVL